LTLRIEHEMSGDVFIMQGSELLDFEFSSLKGWTKSEKKTAKLK
jgi:hypothetical protein